MVQLILHVLFFTLLFVIFIILSIHQTVHIRPCSKFACQCLLAHQLLTNFWLQNLLMHVIIVFSCQHLNNGNVCLILLPLLQILKYFDQQLLNIFLSNNLWLLTCEHYTCLWILYRPWIIFVVDTYFIVLCCLSTAWIVRECCMFSRQFHELCLLCFEYK